MNELQKNVDMFLNHFEERLNQVKSSDFELSNNLFKKILYVGFIDTLSKTTPYSKKGNRKRVVTFVQNFSKWDECERVSLTHLIKLLKKDPSPEFSKVRDYAHSLYDKWKDWDCITLDRDPTYDEIKKLWPTSVTKPLEIENIQLDFLKHSNLFYKYRNNLVHELREPGYGIEFKEDTKPYYHSMHHSENEMTWELVYPLGFYEHIINSAILSLREYYIKDQIDPYKSFNFGTYWLEELNR